MPTLNIPVAASADDADQAAGVTAITGSNLNVNGSAMYMGFRFLNVTIAPGSTVTSADITVSLPSGSFDDPDLTLGLEDVDDAAQFTAGGTDLSTRYGSLTTATATWTATGIGTGVKTSPSLVTAVQEVIDRAGWASGQDMAVLIKGNSAGSAFRVSAFDGGGGTYATLNITYTAPASGVIPVMLGQYRRRGS